MPTDLGSRVYLTYDLDAQCRPDLYGDAYFIRGRGFTLDLRPTHWDTLRAVLKEYLRGCHATT